MAAAQPNGRAMLLLSPLLLLLLLAMAMLPLAHGLDNGLGLTPAMGWNSWNHFHCTFYV